MPPDATYLRFPSIRGEWVSFVADDDVWVVPASGGTARRLTVDHAPASFTRLSPSGDLVAFTSGRDGAAEVFVAGLDGGEVRRLSWFGDPTTRVLGWRDDSTVLAISAAAQPFRSRTWAYALAVEPDGEPERLPFGPITGLGMGPGGMTVLGINQSRARGASWKRYRGGTAAKLWIDRAGDGQFARFLAGLDGQLEDPAFVGERVLFVSDHEGVGNLYSALPDESDLRRHSDHDHFYARFAATDGTRAVYQCAGELWVLDELSADSQPRRVEVELGTPRSGRARRMLRAAEALGEFEPDATGRASAVEVRGRVFWLTHRDGPARWLGAGGAARGRMPCVVGPPGRQSVLFVTDAEGDDALELVPEHGTVAGDAARRLGSGELGRALELTGSRDGKWAAVASHDGRVVLIGLEDGGIRTLDHSEFGEARGLCFSADSRWLAWSHAGSAGEAERALRQIRAADVAGGEVREVTTLRFHDHDPVFSHDGKYLVFLSERAFDPVHDVQTFDMAFLSATRPYLVTLQAATPSPFAAEPDGRPRGGTGEGAGSAGGQGTDAAGHEGEVPEVAAPGGGASAQPADTPPGAVGPTPVEIDFEGIGERVVPFPVATGTYWGLRAAQGGVLYLAGTISGPLGEGRAREGGDPDRPRLLRFDLAKAQQSELVGELDTYDVSGDGRVVVVRDHEALRALPADHKVDPSAPPDQRDPDEVVEIDLSRIRVELDPPVEWRQMYEEAARLMRDHFWVADMGGVDWQAAVERYRPLLDAIATRDDLSELIWEVQGELGASHAYETPPPRPVEDERRVGKLGADLARDGDGMWRVSTVLPGETSVLAARSPLAAPAVGVRPGDAILAVDGVPVDPRRGPQELLVGTAGKPVELTVRPTGGEPRRVVVETLRDERPLRYQAWVAGRRDATHELSGGRAGYVHIPDMMAQGWAELHRDLRLEVARDALLIDIRDNGGGELSELVLDKIGRHVTAWVTVRHLAPMVYPSDSPRGARVLLTNEFAGSDGDIVTVGFRQRGLGPVVGLRTWGGVIGIDMRYGLVDGSMVTQPRYSFWFYDGFGWGVENHGVEPDIEAPFPPQDWAVGRDPQLERALGVLMDRLAEFPPATPPDPATRPSRAAPPLPPRP